MSCAAAAPEQAPPEAGAGRGEADEVFFVALSYRGASYEVPVQSEEAVASIFDFVQEALDFPRENCKLIHRGKVLRPDHDDLTVGEAGLTAGAKLMLVASSAHDVAFVQKSRADPLVKGFTEEERDEASRRKRMRAGNGTAWGTKQDPEFCFGSIKAEFKYNTPSPFEAERLLQKLATDPGIIDIMKSRSFKVGVLTEMSPQEAADRMSKRGTPGMDLLGYNMGAGGMIVLKLRTDNTKGFRPYHDLINTLIHELTHNVWGPHDNNFWKLYGELKAQYMRFHRFWSHGGRAAGSDSNEQFAGFSGDGDEGDASGSSGFGHVLGGGEAPAHALGGGLPESAAERRAQALRALEQRTLQQEQAALVEEAKMVGEAPAPNFLAGDGTWKMMCPCGQVHDGPPCMAAAPSADPAAQAVAEAQGDGVPSPREATGEAPAEAAPSGAAAAEAPLPGPGPPAPAEADAGAELGQQAWAPPAEAPGQLAPDVPGLDRAELEASGLDGASVWIERFSGQLRAFLAPPSGPAGLRPEARAAVEMLLRLVRNIVGSPGEAKFRKIRAGNPRIRACLLGAGAEVESLMTMLGFEHTTEAGEQVYVIRDKTFDCARLRLGQELLEMELGPRGLRIPPLCSRQGAWQSRHGARGFVVQHAGHWRCQIGACRPLALPDWPGCCS
ncbi:unnamed protein product [Prorocentrum cordatum]|uniref:WLM domain-containing protein n=1 Tax=Prorocentrum cordatum TaxID=2364126 RepID=A0ABN9TD02_9DINO|nr:unnamed protein product [Polarella glacialis]